jgi:hypothetical protein
MADLVLVERALHWLSLACTLVLIVKLLRHGLHRIYPSFFYFLVLDLARSVAVLPLSPSQTRFAQIYLVTEVLRWVLYFMVVRELYGLVLERHPGIASVGRTILAGGIFISAAIAMVTIGPDLANASGLYPVLHMANVLSRAIVTTLVFFLIVLAGFLCYYPIELNRNVVYYCIGYAIYFSAKGMVYLMRNLAGPEITRAASVGNLLMATLCFLFWALKLNRTGEQQRVVVGTVWRRERAERLLEQLDAVNKALAREARR